jgi:hypothetical protein
VTPEPARPDAARPPARDGAVLPGDGTRRPRAEPSPAERRIDARLAHLHLRVGMLALARAELETMAGDGSLDVPAMADLAEVRWRTGDLPGAGDAALAHIGSGGREAVAYVVAAEAYAAQGRSADARRMASEVLGRGLDLEAVFAGEAQSNVWDAAGVGGATGRPSAAPATAAPQTARERDRADAARSAVAAAGSHRHDTVDPAAVSPAIGAARIALRARDPAGVASRLAVALRADLAAVAEDVLEIADEALHDAGRLDAAALQLIRGDALTLLERAGEAAEAYRESNRALSGGREEAR